MKYYKIFKTKRIDDDGHSFGSTQESLICMTVTVKISRNLNRLYKGII